MHKVVRKQIKKIRVCYQYSDDTYLYVTPVDIVAEELLKVRYDVAGMNDAFNSTVAQLWRYAQVNLLDVSIDEEGVYTPAFIVLEPDYLIDSAHWPNVLKITDAIRQIII